MKMQKYSKIIDKFVSSRAFSLLFNKLTVGDITSLAKINVSSSLAATPLLGLGPATDFQALVKAIVELDIEYVGVDNQVLKNLYESATIGDLSFIRHPILDKLRDHHAELICEYISYELALEFLTVLLESNVGKE